MLARLKDFFSQHLQTDASADDGVHRLHLAAAALLIEVGRADYSFDADEEQAIAELLVNALQLSREEVAELIQLAHSETRQAVDLHPFTHLINQQYSPAQKRQLLEYLWRVAFADQHLDKYEEHLIRRIAELLHISHRDFIRAKHRAEAELKQNPV